MANELDKTIEELEAEVRAELDEAMHDAPTKGAVPAEPMKKQKNGQMQDTGKAVVDPEQKDAPSKKTTGAAKEIGSDPAQKGEVPPEKMKKVKEGFTDNEIRELCHSKDHDCATVVEHPVWGKGKPILRSHAIPDDDGHVEWYDVQFKHGIEEKVMASDMDILENATHGSDVRDKEDDKEEDKDMMTMTNAQLDAEMQKVAADAHAKIDKDMKKAKNGKKADKVKMIAATKQYGEMSHGDKEDDDEDMEEAIEKRVQEVDVKEHVDALVNGEGDLSEEFKRKAATVFEAAVKSKIRDEVTRLEKEYSSELQENINQTKEELSEKVDTYLNYVVEEWMKENELAIERGLKGEIAEDFISGLKTLFEDHYVDIPDEKYDVLEAQSEKITELEGKLNESVKRIVNLKKNNGTLVREQVIREETQDLAETEIEKFKSLTEDVEFTDEESFREKLGTLKENYFPKQKKEETTETIDDVETGLAQDVDTTDSMKAYMSAIGKFGNSAK